MCAVCFLNNATQSKGRGGGGGGGGGGGVVARWTLFKRTFGCCKANQSALRNLCQSTRGPQPPTLLPLLAMPEILHEKAGALRAAGKCAEAASLLEEAIVHGHLSSRADLADMLMQGRGGVAQDCTRAFGLLEEGASLGCHHCQGMLAFCLLEGVQGSGWEHNTCSRGAHGSMDFGMQEIYGTPNKNYLEPILVSNRKDYGSTGEHGAGGLARALVWVVLKRLVSRR